MERHTLLYSYFLDLFHMSITCVSAYRGQKNGLDALELDEP